MIKKIEWFYKQIYYINVFLFKVKEVVLINWINEIENCNFKAEIQ